MVSDDVNEQTMVGASNKPFDYLACGIPILVSDRPDWREMFVRAGFGLSCNPASPESIAMAVRWFLDHQEQARKMGELGRQQIQIEWNYRREFEPILNRILQ
jgi:glycosyltransferase involved in cell wall biosynthesis